MINTLKLGIRLLLRALRAGELNVLVAALFLAVFASTWVHFLTDKATRALSQEATRLLGGDRVVVGRTALSEEIQRLIQETGLQSAGTVTFPSMLRHQDRSRLFELRAVDDGYPLRGAFSFVGDAPTVPRPAPGTVWLSSDGAPAINAKVGDVVHIGERRLTLAGVVDQAPDVSFNYFDIAPLAFIHRDDLKSTGLVQFGSRLRYRLALSGTEDQLQAFDTEAEKLLTTGQRIQKVGDEQPEIRAALDRAGSFFSLASLVTVMLAAIALALSAHRHARRQIDGSALLRCLGATQRHILLIQLGGLLLLGLLVSAVAVASAFLAQLAISGWLAEALSLSLPNANWLPALTGLALGLSMLFGFALPAMLALANVPAMATLRREYASLSVSATLTVVLAMACFAGIVMWQAHSRVLASWFLTGLSTTALVLALVAFGLLGAVKQLGRRLSGALRYGLAQMSRRPSISLIQIVALGLGLTAILLLTVVRGDLLDRWQGQLADNTPNRFLIDIQDSQRAPMNELLAKRQHGAPDYYPLIRAKLVSVNGVAVQEKNKQSESNDDQAPRNLGRDFNLTELALPIPKGREDNRFVEGQSWPETNPPAGEFSVEMRVAKRLGFHMGDTLVFEGAGRQVSGKITSVREVQWDSFKPNFFVVASPGTLAGLPRNHIAAMRFEGSSDETATLTNDLVQAFPNINVIDVSGILNEVRQTADRVATAVQFIFWFTIIAGALVLIAAVNASQDERLHEAALMRTLGASSKQLRLAQISEFATLGLLAGLVAALAASSVSLIMAKYVFKLPMSVNWLLIASGVLIGLAAAIAAGLWATKKVLSTPAVVVLRGLR